MFHKKSYSERLAEFRAKRERQKARKQPTKTKQANGQTRANGKTKHVAREKQKNLRTAGFKPVPLSDWWINSAGVAYNKQTERQSKPRTIKADGKEWKTEKVVLWLFAGIKPRGGQIVHIDGNKANTAVENLKYATVVTLPTETINRENLCTAIRCFFEISKRAKPATNDIIVLTYLGEIYKAVRFAERYGNEPYFIYFEKWIARYAHGVTGMFKPETIEQPNALTAREMLTIKAHYTNRLTAEICADLSAGVYELKPFAPTPAQRQKQELEKLKAYGITIPKKPRRKSDKQILRDYEKWLNDFKQTSV